MDGTLKKHLALLLVVIVGLSITYMLKDFITSIASAVILAYLVYPIYKYVFKKTNSKTLSASIIIISLLVIIAIPVSIIANFVLTQVVAVDISPNALISYEESIERVTGMQVSLSSGIIYVEEWIKSQAVTTLPRVVSLTSNFFLNAFIMFFIMFYLLVQKEQFLSILKSFIPFSKKHSDYLVVESGKIIRAILLGQVFTAIIQGGLGLIAFLIVGIDNAFIWGFLMMGLSIIPMIGAFLIWVPAGIFLLMQGMMWQGIFVLVWGAIIISQADNLIRPHLVNKFANIHPIETLLGIFMGIATFGFVGIVVGPLIMSLFALLVKVFRKEYVKL